MSDGGQAETLAEVLASVPGWLSPAEAWALCELARTWPGPGRIVELGSARGRSTACLALGLRARSGAEPPVLAVDTHRGSPEHQPGAPHFLPESWDEGSGRVDTLPAFTANLSRVGLTDFVECWLGTSLEAAQAFGDTVRLLFVDADHSEAAVRADIAAWQPHLAPQGLIILHDVGVWPGPTAVADEMLTDGAFRVVQRVDSLLALARRDGAVVGQARDVGGGVWQQTLAGDEALRRQWQTVEGGVWRWEADGLRLEGAGAEWAAQEWQGEPSLVLPSADNFVIELGMSGHAEAAGVSFGAYKDFLVRLEGNGTRLYLDVDAARGTWLLRRDAQMMPRAWWDGAVRDAADILAGPLTLKSRWPREVLFEDLQVHRLQSSCRLSVILTSYRFLQRLRVTLRAWCEQDLPAGAWEILVVNPGSPDGAHEHLAAVARSYPGVRLREVLVEPELSVNKGALINRALSVCHGEWVWIADADCLYESHSAARVLEQASVAADRLYYAQRRYLDGKQTAALLSGRLDPVHDFARLAARGGPRAPDCAPWGYTQIVHRSVAQQVRYREDINNYAYTDNMFVADCQSLGLKLQPIADLVCLHLDHPFAWYGAPQFL